MDWKDTKDWYICQIGNRETYKKTLFKKATIDSRVKILYGKDGKKVGILQILFPKKYFTLYDAQWWLKSYTASLALSSQLGSLNAYEVEFINSYSQYDSALIAKYSGIPSLQFIWKKGNSLLNQKEYEKVKDECQKI